MRPAMGIPVCLAAAFCGWAVAAPPPAERVVPAIPLVPPAAPAVPRSLWCENVVEMQTARRSGVTSVWLSNGVRVHHLRIAARPGQVVATIAISGGKLLEDANTRGTTEIVAGVLDNWETAAPIASVAEQMAGRDVRIDAGAGLDALTLQLSGSLADAGAAMLVVRELLTSPTVTRAGVDVSREQLVHDLRMRRADARSAVMDATNSAIGAMGGGVADARMVPPEERTLVGIAPERVTEWVRRHAGENGAAIEVAIVGDLALADALAMVDTTLGTLPKREQVSARTNAPQRVLAGGPVAAVRKDVSGVVPVGAGRATVVRGCFGPEMAALAEQRVLRALVRVAIARVRVRLAEPEFGVAGSVDVAGGVYVSPFAGRGMVLVTATAEGRKAAAIGDAIEAELAKLAAAPPTADELTPIADELGKMVTKLEQDAAYWSAVLARCDALGMDPDEIASGAAYYKVLTPEKCSEVFRKFWRDERRIAITVRGPERAEPVSTAAPAPTSAGKR